MVVKASAPNGDAVLYTEHIDHLPTFCPESGRCCDDVPAGLKALVWIDQGTSGGPLTPPLPCEEIGLTKDGSPQPDGSYSWRGNATSGTWSGCITPNNFEVVWNCSNAVQEINLFECDKAHGVTIHGHLVTRDDSCCCRPVCWVGAISLPKGSGGTLLEADASSSCGVTSPSDVTMFVWIFEPDPTTGNVSCIPNPYPDQNCKTEPDVDPCDELGAVEMDLVAASVWVQAFFADMEAEETAVEMEVARAQVQLQAGQLGMEIANEDVSTAVSPATVNVIAAALGMSSMSPDCCPNIPSTLTATIWLEEEPPAGGGSDCLQTDTITLTKEPGTRANWSGLSTFGKWIGCLEPIVFPIRLECRGTGVNCSSLFTVRINNKAMGIFSCTCNDGGLGQMAVATSVSTVSSLMFSVSPANACGIINPGAAAMGVYIRAAGASTTLPPNPCD